MKKRRLRYYFDSWDRHQRKSERWCYYRDMVETTPDKCDICKHYAHLEELNLPPGFMNLAKANIARHLATNKHWCEIGSGKYLVR